LAAELVILTFLELDARLFDFLFSTIHLPLVYSHESFGLVMVSKCALAEELGYYTVILRLSSHQLCFMHFLQYPQRTFSTGPQYLTLVSKR
jgi:hypothetical protein